MARVKVKHWTGPYRKTSGEAAGEGEMSEKKNLLDCTSSAEKENDKPTAKKLRHFM